MAKFLIISPSSPTLLPHCISSPKPKTHFFNPPLHTQTPIIPKLPFSSSSSSYNNYTSPPEKPCPVPLEQQPINEYQNLSSSSPYSWALGDLLEYAFKLLVTGAAFALFVGLPVSWYGSVGLDLGLLQRVVGAVTSGVVVAIVTVVRMYLGWAHVGNRLLSATVEYEETGWYDGQMWVKTPEVLARDRLLGSYSVKPVLGRLKNTLVGLGISLFMCTVLLFNTEGAQKVSYVSEEAGGRSVSGVYNDESARSFEPEAFCGEPGLP